MSVVTNVGFAPKAFRHDVPDRLIRQYHHIAGIGVEVVPERDPRCVHDRHRRHDLGHGVKYGEDKRVGEGLVNLSVCWKGGIGHATINDWAVGKIGSSPP